MPQTTQWKYRAPHAMTKVQFVGNLFFSFIWRHSFGIHLLQSHEMTLASTLRWSCRAFLSACVSIIRSSIVRTILYRHCCHPKRHIHSKIHLISVNWGDYVTANNTSHEMDVIRVKNTGFIKRFFFVIFFLFSFSWENKIATKIGVAERTKKEYKIVIVRVFQH